MEFRKVTLDEISINGGSYGIGASAVEYNQDLFTYLRITDINEDGTLDYKNDENYEDIAGFCKVATTDEIKENNFVLTPGRYVGTEEVEDDGIPFEEKMADLTSKLAEQMQEGAKLDEEIKKVLGAIGYGI